MALERSAAAGLLELLRGTTDAWRRDRKVQVGHVRDMVRSPRYPADMSVEEWAYVADRRRPTGRRGPGVLRVGGGRRSLDAPAGRGQ